VLARVFEPFFTTKGPGEGTGMGLALVHGLVASHEGAITVASAPGQGATFEIYLPQVAASPATDAPHAEPLPRGQGNILLVDDEAAVAHVGQVVFEHLGYRVSVCLSSLEALETFRAAPQRYDLVITDQTMPRLSGDALIRALRSVRPDIPVILCTGFSHTMDAETAEALSIDAFLTKPWSTHELASTIQRVLARKG
jgi:CheY-like chemotaxis protein